MTLTAQITENSIQGTARIVVFNMHPEDRGLLVAELANGEYVSLRTKDHGLHLISIPGDIIDLNIEWILNKDLNILGRDILASGDEKEFTKIEIENLSHVDRVANTIVSFDLKDKVFNILNFKTTL